MQLATGEDNQPSTGQSTIAADPITTKEWGDDELSTTEDGSPAPTVRQVVPIIMDNPAHSDDNKLLTTEAGTPEPMCPVVTNTADPVVAATEPELAPTKPKVAAANPIIIGPTIETTIIGATNEPHPPVNSHLIPIYTLASPPPTVPYSLEEFLTECHITAEDQRTRVILGHHQIHHWSHFTGSDKAELRDMGLDRGPARALCAGARACNRRN